jgi:DNA polymerase III sliding clamp (beta) subunit (PCNA family)
VLFEVDGAVLTLVATDRHRMAVSAVPVTDRSGPPARVSVPRTELGRVAALTGDPLDGRIDGDVLRLGDLVVTAHPGEYPAYRVVTGSVGGQPIAVDAAELRAMLADGPVHTVPDTPGEVAGLGLDPAGALRVVDPGAPGFVAAVNRGFLLDALEAAPAGQLVLDLDGPLHPLAVRHPTDQGTYSVLMPVRLP